MAQDNRPVHDVTACGQQDRIDHQRVHQRIYENKRSISVIAGDPTPIPETSLTFELAWCVLKVDIKLVFLLDDAVHFVGQQLEQLDLGLRLDVGLAHSIHGVDEQVFAVRSLDETDSDIMQLMSGPVGVVAASKSAYLVVGDGLGEAVERRQVQIDRRDKVQQLLGLEVVLFRVLDFQIFAPGAAELLEIEIEHGRQAIDQFLETHQALTTRIPPVAWPLKAIVTVLKKGSCTCLVRLLNISTVSVARVR